MPHQRLVFAALVLGLVLGSVIAAYPAPGLYALVDWAEAVGTLWLNALRMVVVPLVVCLLVAGVASITDIATVRRMGGTSIVVWIGLLLVSAVLGLTLIPFLFSGLTIDAAATSALRESAASLAGATTQGLERMPALSQWLVELVPANPVRAAVDGAMLPLVIFALTLGLAVTRVPASRRDALVGFLGGAADAMLVIVRWVLVLTPLGVFGLSIGVASRIGVSAAGAVGYLLAVTGISMVVLMIAIFVITSTVGRVAPLPLARALLPAQLVGFTSRSSLASLPAQAEAATTQLRLPPHVAGFVLPLAVASFKPHGPLNWSSLAVFSALLYGIPLGPAELLTVVTSAILLSFAVPGIPSAGMLLSAPVFTGIGIPVEALGILIAVDAIPDMFKTAANVTGQLSSAVIVARFTTGRIAEGVEAASESGVAVGPALGGEASY